MRKFCDLSETSRSLMKSAMSQLQLSTRAYHRILKLARTIADPSLRSGQAWLRRCSTGGGECRYNHSMLHRHLSHQKFTLAAIDDLIARGKPQDWAELRRVALEDRAVLEKVLRVCQVHIADPYAQRYHFWKHYAEKYLA